MTSELNTLTRAHSVLGWPSPENICRPTGAGAAVFSELVQEKIGRAIAHFDDAKDAIIGLLMADSEAVATEPPICIVVEFQRAISDVTLRELHRLAWNFSHCPALITIEPSVLRVWSCCIAPDSARPLSAFLVHEVGSPDSTEMGLQTLERRAARALHWINLVSGEFFRERAERFDRDGRADQMLLRNLRHIRSELASVGLIDDDICHDLLARIIFVQFLFDRKDSDGNAALGPVKLARLHSDGILQRRHADFRSILRDYDDTYRLFDWLNARFNGDLFPGKGDTPSARSRGWVAEKRVVTKQHLALLADFIGGELDMPSGQSCLWPQYAFDVIPLEFISSIYETFVTERAADEGIFYTPPHLVDFVLDQVLPWGGKEWDLTILDPACGSGIFLVKAFQRLIHRWKLANSGQQVRAETLRRLLEKNIFGVDKDSHAVRVACFSLYLAMCDEIDPRHYWTQVVFPPMRGRRLVCADFFQEDSEGFRTNEDAATYSLIIGNAPWGEKLLTPAARDWATKNDNWPLVNLGIGTLFLPKSAQLLKPGGRAAIIQSASSLLFNRQRLAIAFRQKLLSSHRVEEIINLSALRFRVFKRKTHAIKTSVSPACIVILTPSRPSEDERISYISPKQVEQSVNDFQIIIEPLDRRSLTIREATLDTVAWSALMWGNNRDRALLSRLRSLPSLGNPGAQYKIKRREGIIFGDRKKPQPKLHDRPILDTREFPGGSLLRLNVDNLPRTGIVKTDSRASTDFGAFEWPQLIVKQAWQKGVSRFQARLTTSSNGEGALCTQSYLTVHAPAQQSKLLEAACITLNSIFATYFLLLTSGRFATYRPEPLVEELLAIPVPEPRAGLLTGIRTDRDIDNRIFDAFGFKDSERVLVEDLFNITLPDFQGDNRSPGRQKTLRESDGNPEPQLTAYCQYFGRVLKAGFGSDKEIGATIFQETESDSLLPYRIVAFELGKSGKQAVEVSRMKHLQLYEELRRLGRRESGVNPIHGNVCRYRIARVYETINGVPTVFIIKPDMCRYWTRSSGLVDADDVALDLNRWAQASRSPPKIAS